jgi:predicted kinase
VLRYYLVYRALVRAKVNVLRARQPRVLQTDRNRLARLAGEYLALARTYTTPQPVALIITHGLSGSGKTSATQSLIELAGAVRVRSDIERKRLYGLKPLARSGSGMDTGIYTPAAHAATYGRLAALARGILAAGWPVVVDAAFLRRAERDAFRALAADMGVPFVILDFVAPAALLAQRVAARAASGHDASEADRAVIERQLASREPLAPEELPAAFTIDASRPVSSRTWRPVLARLRVVQGHSSRQARPLFSR